MLKVEAVRRVKHMLESVVRSMSDRDYLEVLGELIEDFRERAETKRDEISNQPSANGDEHPRGFEPGDEDSGDGD